MDIELLKALTKKDIETLNEKGDFANHDKTYSELLNEYENGQKRLKRLEKKYDESLLDDIHNPFSDNMHKIIFDFENSKKVLETYQRYLMAKMIAIKFDYLVVNKKIDEGDYRSDALYALGTAYDLLVYLNNSLKKDDSDEFKNTSVEDEYYEFIKIVRRRSDQAYRQICRIMIKFDEAIEKDDFKSFFEVEDAAFLICRYANSLADYRLYKKSLLKATAYKSDDPNIYEFKEEVSIAEGGFIIYDEKYLETYKQAGIEVEE